METSIAIVGVLMGALVIGVYIIIRDYAETNRERQPRRVRKSVCKPSAQASPESAITTGDEASSHYGQSAPSDGLIFVSYRRDDSADVAGRIYDRLTARFGKATVFKDVDSIPLGVDYRWYLQERVGSCHACLANHAISSFVITPTPSLVTVERARIPCVRHMRARPRAATLSDASCVFRRQAPMFTRYVGHVRDPAVFSLNRQYRRHRVACSVADNQESAAVSSFRCWAAPDLWIPCSAVVPATADGKPTESAWAVCRLPGQVWLRRLPTVGG